MPYEIAIRGMYDDLSTVTIETYDSMEGFFSTVQVVKPGPFGLEFRRDHRQVTPYVSKVSAGISFINANCIKHYDHREFKAPKGHFIELSRVTKRVKTSGSCSAVGAGSQAWYWYALLPEMHPDAKAILSYDQLSQDLKRGHAELQQLKSDNALISALDKAVATIGYDTTLHLLTRAVTPIEETK